MNDLIYTRMTEHDKLHLRGVIRNRWLEAWKRLLFSTILPIVFLSIALIVIAEVLSHKPVSDIQFPDDLLFLIILSPLLLLLLAINFVWFLRRVFAVYYDIWKGKKRLIEFRPAPYTISGTNKYFINTDLPYLRFIPVSYEQYMAADYSKDCYLEITPVSKVILGIKTQDNDDEIIIG